MMSPTLHIWPASQGDVSQEQSLFLSLQNKWEQDVSVKHLHTLMTTVSNSDLGLKPLTSREIGIIYKFMCQCTNLKVRNK